jgi:hypothetical protein
MHRSNANLTPENRNKSDFATNRQDTPEQSPLVLLFCNQRSNYEQKSARPHRNLQLKKEAYNMLCDHIDKMCEMELLSLK